MSDISPFQVLSKTFTYSSKVILPNIKIGIVKLTFDHLFNIIALFPNIYVPSRSDFVKW